MCAPSKGVQVAKETHWSLVPNPLKAWADPRMSTGPHYTPLAPKFSQAKEALCPFVHLSVSKVGSLERERGVKEEEVMVMGSKGKIQIGE